MLSFLVTLTVLIFVHEMGHYLVARWNSVQVQVFSIGFGPEILGWSDVRGTRWKISLIPLGGYVKFLGDMGVSSQQVDASHSGLTDQERLSAFQYKALHQRAAIVAAGPAANFILAIIILALVFSFVGQPFTSPVVNSVEPGSPAEVAGLQAGDRFVRVGSERIDRFEDLQRIVQIRPNQQLRVLVERGNDEIRLLVKPRLIEVQDRFGNVHKIGQLGVRSSTVEYLRHNPLAAIWQAVETTIDIVVTTLVAVKQMIVGDRGTKELAGVIGIAQMSGEVAQIGFLAAIQFAAFLSISLGLINLFPVPMLDGGHLLFYTFEALLGRPINLRLQEIGLRLGLAVVLGLFLLTTFNDLNRLNFFGLISDLFG